MRNLVKGSDKENGGRDRKSQSPSCVVFNSPIPPLYPTLPGNPSAARKPENLAGTAAFAAEQWILGNIGITNSIMVVRTDDNMLAPTRPADNGIADGAFCTLFAVILRAVQECLLTLLAYIRRLTRRIWTAGLEKSPCNFQFIAFQFSGAELIDQKATNLGKIALFIQPFHAGRK
jgi:hypothetical protein